MKLKRKTIIIIVLLAMTIVLTVILLLRINEEESIEPLQNEIPVPEKTAEPSSDLINKLREDYPLLGTNKIKPDAIKIGVSTLEDLTSFFGDPIKQSGNSYEFDSNSNVDNNLAIFEEGNLVFFKEIITFRQERTITSISQKYNLANPVILYNEDYKYNNALNVYPTLGIAFNLNLKDQYLIEVWYFEPMNLDEFREKYAQDYYLTIEEFEQNLEPHF